MKLKEENSTLFKRAPYWGWFLLALFAWAFTAYRDQVHHHLTRPSNIAELIGKDLAQRNDALEHELKNADLVKKIFSGKLSLDEVNKLADAPFFIYAFEQESDEDNILIFWNSNQVVGVCNQHDLTKEDYTLFRNNGTYLKRCIRTPDMLPFQTLVALLPINTNYAIHNDYLQSAFVAANFIPATTKVLTDSIPNSVAVRNAEGKPLFYIQIMVKDIPRWIPDAAMDISLILAVLFSVTWIQLLAVFLARKRKRWMGLLLILSAGIATLSFVYFAAPHFHLSELPLFSTQLYAASVFVPSLGALILDMLCLLWVLLYFFKHFPSNITNGWRSVLNFIIGLILWFIATIGPVVLVKSLVIDSGISFDAESFYSVSEFMVVGLFTVGLIWCNSAIILYGLNRLFNNIFKSVWIKYALLISLAIVLQFFAQNIGWVLFKLSLWGVFFIALLDARNQVKWKTWLGSDVVFGAAFLALVATLSLQSFAEMKEADRRKVFAEEIVRQRDEIMEYAFNSISDSLSKSEMLQAFLSTPSADARMLVDEKLFSNYLRGLSRYDAQVYIFDSKGLPLFNPDTEGLPHFESLDAKDRMMISNTLFFRPNSRDGHFYLAAIPILNSVGNSLGKIFIDLSLKKSSSTTVYPELLQPTRQRESEANKAYTYAVYVNQKLWSQTGNYAFPLSLTHLNNRSELELSHLQTSVFVYPVSAEKTVVIVQNKTSAMRTATLFSYMLGVLMVIVLIFVLFQLYFYFILGKNRTSRFFRPTIQRRIHFAMLGVVFVSFFIIGAATIAVFVQRFDQTTKNRLRAAITRIEKSIRQELKSKNVLNDAIAFDAMADEPAFKKFIADLASSQSLDINVYSSLGELTATSQDEIYNKLIVARLMMPDAYFKLSVMNEPFLSEEENIGGLHYLAGYVPIRNEKDEAVGYINMPYFASQAELNGQISTIIVALINIIAVVFIVSVAFALIVTQWITRGLQMVIARFQRFNLQSNEPIVWDHDDEIGLLVRAYNNMVKKVEESTSKLAQSERETAWREMAKQVAHEIKNPLTPMKLNIQYLQNALQSGHPDAPKLVRQVTGSLIEQIDNLSYIASAFSDFAKMPEAKPETIFLNELLKTAVDLFKSEKVSVHLQEADVFLPVYADRSQLLRVFTNLLQNAVEAIVDEHNGIITVSLSVQDGKALVKVKDNGSGISEQVVDKIFSPYFTTKGSGTGLGLAMTKRIIEFWQGNIWFETTQNVGTTFFIVMPIQSAMGTVDKS
ncbi:MAG: GHKL domain-containing protein [Bacteroidetes bacterium]|nr:GHKL domain-containing protein [Bacteroidota bacterium]